MLVSLLDEFEFLSDDIRLCKLAIDTVGKIWVVDVADAALVITITEDTVLCEPGDYLALIGVGPILVEALRVTAGAGSVEGLHSCTS